MKGIPASMSQLAKLPKWLERSIELNDLSDLNAEISDVGRPIVNRH